MRDEPPGELVRNIPVDWKMNWKKKTENAVRNGWWIVRKPGRSLGTEVFRAPFWVSTVRGTPFWWFECFVFWICTVWGKEGLGAVDDATSEMKKILEYLDSGKLRFTCELEEHVSSLKKSSMQGVKVERVATKPRPSSHRRWMQLIFLVVSPSLVYVGRSTASCRMFVGQ